MRPLSYLQIRNSPPFFISIPSNRTVMITGSIFRYRGYIFLSRCYVAAQLPSPPGRGLRLTGRISTSFFSKVSSCFAAFYPSRRPDGGDDGLRSMLAAPVAYGAGMDRCGRAGSRLFHGVSEMRPLSYLQIRNSPPFL